MKYRIILVDRRPALIEQIKPRAPEQSKSNESRSGFLGVLGSIGSGALNRLSERSKVGRGKQLVSSKGLKRENTIYSKVDSSNPYTQPSNTRQYDLNGNRRIFFGKKGVSPVTIIFWSLTFIIVWAMFIGPLLATWGHVAVVNGDYTGVEALFYENLNWVVFIMFFIFMAAVGSVTTQ